MRSKEQLVNGLILFALLGVLLSLYSWLHNQGFASGDFCSIGETFDCDTVNKGPYGKFLGVPVSLLGVIGYELLMIAVVVKKKQMEDKSLNNFILLASLGGLTFALYLTGIEAFVLHAWCLLCLTSQALIIAITFLATRLYILDR